MISSYDNLNTNYYLVSPLGTRGFSNIVSFQPHGSLRGPPVYEGPALAQVTQLVRGAAMSSLTAHPCTLF